MAEVTFRLSTLSHRLKVNHSIGFVWCLYWEFIVSLSENNNWIATNWNENIMQMLTFNNNNNSTDNTYNQNTIHQTQSTSTTTYVRRTFPLTSEPPDTYVRRVYCLRNVNMHMPFARNNILSSDWMHTQSIRLRRHTQYPCLYSNKNRLPNT